MVWATDMGVVDKTVGMLRFVLRATHKGAVDRQVLWWVGPNGLQSIVIYFIGKRLYSMEYLYCTKDIVRISLWS